jgi:hypothetical protein
MTMPRLIERLESAGASGCAGGGCWSVGIVLGDAVVSGDIGAGCSASREQAASTSVVEHISVEIRRRPRMQIPPSDESQLRKKPLLRILRPRHSRIHAQQNTGKEHPAKSR